MTVYPLCSLNADVIDAVAVFPETTKDGDAVAAAINIRVPFDGFHVFRMKSSDDARVSQSPGICSSKTGIPAGECHFPHSLPDFSGNKCPLLFCVICQFITGKRFVSEAFSFRADAPPADE